MRRWDQQDSDIHSSSIIKKHQPLSDIKKSNCNISPSAPASYHKYYEDEKKLCVSSKTFYFVKTRQQKERK